MLKISSKELYHLLYDYYGQMNWWSANSTYERMVGAILVQNTKWANVELALDQLRAATDLEAQNILSLSQEELIHLIRPAGFFTNKSRGILAMTQWLASHHYNYQSIADIYGENLRQELLTLPTVGPETADVYFLYVFRQIEFVADKYVQKLYANLGVKRIKNYQSLKDKVSMKKFTLPEAQEFHALIVEFGKNYLRGESGRFEESFLAHHCLIDR